MFEMRRVVGIPITIGALNDVANEIIQYAKKRVRGYVCVANVHMVVTARRNEGLLRIMEDAEFVTCDGMPLVWELRRQGYRDAGRVAGPDLMVKLCETAMEERLPVYFFGGGYETIQALKERIAIHFPTLNVVGYESPPMLPPQSGVDFTVAERIRASGAKIVFVGLGCPKQEFWMSVYSPYIPAILIGVGAAFDFFAGTLSRAPFWMQKSGLEWFYRLLCEPQRLCRRYMVTNTLFIFYLINECLRRRFLQK